MSLETVLSLIVSALLLVYLAYALLRPEKVLKLTFKTWLQILFSWRSTRSDEPMGVFMTQLFNRGTTFIRAQ